MIFNKIFNKINNKLPIPYDLQKYFDKIQQTFKLSSRNIVSINIKKKQLYFSLTETIKIHRLNKLLNDFNELIINYDLEYNIKGYLKKYNIINIIDDKLPLNKQQVKIQYKEKKFSYDEIKFLFLIVNLNITKKKDIKRLLSKLNTGEIICVLNCLHFYEIQNNIIIKILNILFFRVHNLPKNKNKSVLCIFSNLFTKNKPSYIDDFNNKYKIYIKNKISEHEMRISIKKLKANQPIPQPFLNKYGDISDWDTGLVVNMSYMFRNAISFNCDISRWDVSNVQNMIGMFYNALAFNGDISKWDVSNVTELMYMFYNTSTFNSDISRWDVSQVQNMSYMFSYSDIFNADISNWDVSNVQNMSFMFWYALDFNSDLSKWNVSNVQNMTNMFDNAIFFNSDISKWNVSNVTNTAFMFYNAAFFNSDISKWNVSNVIYMNNMFNCAYTFNSDISEWNVSNVTNMMNIFHNAKAFNSDISKWNVKNVINTDNMFIIVKN